MKASHLLDAIDAVSAKSSANEFLTSIELKSLIQEIREASDAVHGVQEFYETLERITNELRGMTEHSSAFLSRVRKAEAPNYYDIIKKPMDLGTVLKKVKSQAYKDKKSFSDDLTLIWDNCLTYNTWPDHPLRKSANILRQKTASLLQFVAEIPTKQATPAPGTARHASAAPLSDADAEGDTDEEADETDRTRKGRTSHKRPPKQPKTEDEATIAVLARTAEGTTHFAPGDAYMDADSPLPEGTPELVRSRSPSVDLRRYQKRKSLATRTDLVPFEERPALLRDASSMAEFEALDAEPDDQPVASTSASTLDAIPARAMREKPLPLAVQQLSGRHSRQVSETLIEPATAEDPAKVQKEWWEDVASDRRLRAGMPAMAYPPCPTIELSCTRVERYRAAEDGARRVLGRNVDKMQRIKGLHGRMAKTDAALLTGDVSALATEEEVEEPLVSTYADLGRSHVPQDVYLTPFASHAASVELQMVCSNLIAAGGFDSVHQSALHVLTTVAMRYLANLGKATRAGLDFFPKQLSAPHLLQHVLAQNGVQSATILSDHVQHGIFGLDKQLDAAWSACLSKRKVQLARVKETAEWQLAKRDQDTAMEEAHAGDQTGRFHAGFSEPFVSLEISDEDERLAAIEAQVGLLRPFLLVRSKTDAGLRDDADSKAPARPTAQVDPSGRIITLPVLKRRHSTGLPGTSKKQKSSREESAAVAL